MDIQRIVLFAGLAIVSYLMVLAWNEDYNQPRTEQVTQVETSGSDGSVDDMVLPESASRTDDEFVTPETGELRSTSSDGEQSVGDQFITVVTDVLELTIDRVGGNVIASSLLQYDESLDSEQPLTLLTNTQNRTYILESGLIGRNGPDGRSAGQAPVYQAEASRFELTDGQDELIIDLKLTTDDGVDITKRYRLARDSYEIDIRYLINNQSDTDWQGNFTGKIVRDEAPDPTSQTTMGIKAYLGLVISTPDDPYEKYDFSDLGKQRVNEPVTNGWLAFLQHYFITAWVPDRDKTAQFQTTRRDQLHVMGFVYPATAVAPGQTVEVGATAYVGPKIIDRLEALAPNLDRTVDFGWLFFISLPLFYILEWFYGLVGNWGVAIILLTVLVKAVFFHLSATSYRSMAKMRAVAPQLTRLKELYGDDRQRMSQEMMALYKREKINPLGGCLPILVQMPVFISLYWVLFESVQLRHAPFMLWINDLSQMDPYFILPILMGISMFIQMSLNPTPPDPMQAKIMKLMPPVFTVFFLWFPAGLVLYWLVNNILSISQQWYITRKIEVEMAGKKH
ncbi:MULTISPECIES: membrane protein insertase YidC [Marinobacter]|jgi:YidC/Oxa1 family membrane protein insertase|uniref:Membrane protein insertase YidC n=3 Tax=Marinobacter TaxID=2742 RepID=A0A455W6I4_MARNT|nr:MULTISPECIES: membrane protein insertase YidC [Marinobacter]KXO07440.1 Inner membrane protein translocase component YidC, long form [Marinobacter excellens LAMA 842]MAO15066.1 membrane protein insertase YidC [Marinobacter sp.]BBJ02205.1 membrane protein insertase YidC [Marinobacter nauticus]